MNTKTAENYVDYQERAREFAPGDLVVPYGNTQEAGGRVIAVYPAIGMADVEFTSGAKRIPVEDLQRFDKEEGTTLPPCGDSTPGGHPTAVSTDTVEVPVRLANSRRVAEAFVKQALYWAASDRRYRATQAEIATGHFKCPKCKEAVLRPAIYKRRGGQSERLLGCPNCLFLVKKSDIIGHPECDAADEAAAVESGEVI